MKEMRHTYITFGLGKFSFRVWLAPDTFAANAWTLMYASFVTIGFLTLVNAGQAYVLNENLGVPRSEQGTITGNLAVLSEIVGILLIWPIGILSDRIGRRPVFVFGLIVMGISFAFYPLVDSVQQITYARFIYSIGTAVSTGMLGTVIQDYPREDSRGKMIAGAGVFNALGVIFVAFVIASLAARFVSFGIEPIAAGRYMHWIVTVILFVSALVLIKGLKGGTPAKKEDRPPLRDLMIAGFRHLHNPRISLSYASAFVGRSDLVITGTFVILWCTLSGIEQGMTTGAAVARAGALFGTIQIVALLWTPILGLIIDRFNRTSAVVFGMFVASIGYSSMYFVDNPLDPKYLPLFIILGIGQVSAFLSSQALIGQEAPLKERGSVVGMFGMFGAVGILITTLVGGILFDEWMRSGPFVFVGCINFLVFLWGALVRVKWPGPMPERTQVHV